MKNIIIFGCNSLVAKSVNNILKNNSDYFIFNFGKNSSFDDIPPKKFDLALFLAQSSDFKTGEFTSDLFFVNNILLKKALEWSIDKAETFINFSTGSVYSTTHNGLYTSRSQLDWNSTNPYVNSKLIGEILINAHRKYFKKAVNVRPFFIYGKGQKEYFLISRILTKIKRGEKIILDSKEGLKFNPITSDDLGQIILKPLINNEGYEKWPNTINLSGNEILTLKQITEHIIMKYNFNRNLLEFSANVKTKNMINHDVDFKDHIYKNWQNEIELMYNEK